MQLVFSGAAGCFSDAVMHSCLTHALGRQETNILPCPFSAGNVTRVNLGPAFMMLGQDISKGKAQCCGQLHNGTPPLLVKQCVHVTVQGSSAHAAAPGDPDPSPPEPCQYPLCCPADALNLTGTALDAPMADIIPITFNGCSDKCKSRR